MSEKNNTFAQNMNDYDEPTALATDSGLGIPILTGDAAERFVRMAEENERKAHEKEKEPMTLEEAKKELSYNKMFLEMAKNNVKTYEDRINKLQNYINSF